MPRKQKSGYSDSSQVRVPPYSQEAERAVLGALILEPEKTLEMLSGLEIKSEWFYIEANRNIFEVIRNLSDKHTIAIDVVTVSDALQEAGLIDAVGGTQYIEQLASGELIAAHAEHYANILKEKYTLRRIINAAEEAVAKCHEPDRTVGTILSESQEAMLSISEGTSTTLPTFKDSLTATYNRIDKLFSPENTGLTGLSTGFKELDKTIQGLRDSEMIVLAARPSMGKTSLAMNICTAVALGANATGKKLSGKEPLPVAIFSCEMSTDSLITRLICSIAEVPYFDLVRSNYATKEQRRINQDRITKGMSRLMNAPFYIDDTGGLDIADVRARARRMKKRYGIRLIMIDYLQLLNCREASSEGRQLETTKISAGIKAMAKELNVPVLVLSQLSRQTENRDKEGRPRMSDLRDSGSIEQDADVILLLRRPCKYPGSKDCDIPDLAIVDVAKNRNGKVGEVELTFIDRLTQFSDRIRPENESPA